VWFSVVYESLGWSLNKVVTKKPVIWSRKCGHPKSKQKIINMDRSWCFINVFNRRAKVNFCTRKAFLLIIKPEKIVLTAGQFGQILQLFTYRFLVCYHMSICKNSSSRDNEAWTKHLLLSLHLPWHAVVRSWNLNKQLHHWFQHLKKNP